MASNAIKSPVLWLMAGLIAITGVLPAQAAQDKCISATDLSSKSGEQRPTKADRRFDAAEPNRSLAPAPAIPTNLRGAIRRVDLPPGKKLIALTLDLCEQPGEVAGYDGAIFDYLRANGVKATVFTGGKWMRSHAARFQQLLTDPLFEIANHASAHRNLRTLSGAALAAEITGPQRAYEALRADASTNACLSPAVTRTPARMSLFRFPYGACNAAAMAAVNDAGLLAIQWDVSTGDPSPGTSAQDIANAMIRGVRPGSIIIAHANGRGLHTAAGLPIAIPKLRAAGFEFVTVTELLAAGRPVIAPTCYNTKPGDTDRYDAIAGPFAPKTTTVGGVPGKPPASRGQPVERLPWQ